MKKHKVTHSEKMVTCKVCGLECTNEKGLKLHTSTKHKVKIEIPAIPEEVEADNSALLQDSLVSDVDDLPLNTLEVRDEVLTEEEVMEEEAMEEEERGAKERPWLNQELLQNLPGISVKMAKKPRKPKYENGLKKEVTKKEITNEEGLNIQKEKAVKPSKNLKSKNNVDKKIDKKVVTKQGSKKTKKYFVPDVQYSSNPSPPSPPCLGPPSCHCPSCLPCSAPCCDNPAVRSGRCCDPSSLGSCLQPLEAQCSAPCCWSSDTSHSESRMEAIKEEFELVRPFNECFGNELEDAEEVLKSCCDEEMEAGEDIFAEGSDESEETFLFDTVTDFLLDPPPYAPHLNADSASPECCPPLPSTHHYPAPSLLPPGCSLLHSRQCGKLVVRFQAPGGATFSSLPGLLSYYHRQAGCQEELYGDRLLEHPGVQVFLLEHQQEEVVEEEDVNLDGCEPGLRWRWTLNGNQGYPGFFNVSEFEQSLPKKSFPVVEEDIPRTPTLQIKKSLPGVKKVITTNGNVSGKSVVKRTTQTTAKMSVQQPKDVIIINEDKPTSSKMKTSATIKSSTKKMSEQVPQSVRDSLPKGIKLTVMPSISPKSSQDNKVIKLDGSTSEASSQSRKSVQVTPTPHKMQPPKIKLIPGSSIKQTPDSKKYKPNTSPAAPSISKLTPSRPAAAALPTRTPTSQVPRKQIREAGSVLKPGVVQRKPLQSGKKLVVEEVTEVEDPSQNSGTLGKKPRNGAASLLLRSKGREGLGRQKLVPGGHLRFSFKQVREVATTDCGMPSGRNSFNRRREEWGAARGTGPSQERGILRHQVKIWINFNFLP